MSRGQEKPTRSHVEADKAEIFGNSRRGGRKREVDGVGVDRHGPQPVIAKVLLRPISTPFHTFDAVPLQRVRCGMRRVRVGAVVRCLWKRMDTLLTLCGGRCGSGYG